MTLIGRLATAVALMLAVTNTAPAWADDPPHCGGKGEKPCYLTKEHWDFVQRQIKALEEERDQLKDEGGNSDSGRIEALEAQIRLLQEQQKAGATTTPPDHTTSLGTPPSIMRRGPHSGWHWAAMLKGETVVFMPGPHHWAGVVAVEGVIRYVADWHMSGELAFFLGVHPAHNEDVEGETVAPFTFGGRLAIGAFWEHAGVSVGPQMTVITEQVENEGLELLVTLPIAVEIIGGNFCGGISVGPALYHEVKSVWVGIGLGGCGHLPD